MKQLLAVFVLAFTLISAAFAGGEEKKVCEDVKDKSGNVVKNKDGSVKQACKTIKVHKKLEGKEVPTK
jgi:hypothetical protein